MIKCKLQKIIKRWCPSGHPWKRAQRRLLPVFAGFDTRRLSTCHATQASAVKHTSPTTPAAPRPSGSAFAISGCRYVKRPYTKMATVSEYGFMVRLTHGRPML